MVFLGLLPWRKQIVISGALLSRFLFNYKKLAFPPELFYLVKTGTASKTSGTMVVFSTPVFTPVGQSSVGNNGILPFCSVPTTPAVLAVPVIKRTCNVALVWQLIFHKLFSRFAPHPWSLVPLQSKPSGRWHTFVDSAKVRFACEACGHGWTSMKGRITFWCSFSNNSGIVAYRLYGQQCDSCQGDSYEPAMWYPEEIEKVLLNIYNRVAHLFYGCARPPIQLNRRPGKPKNPHNSVKCQACKDGVCAERR